MMQSRGAEICQELKAIVEITQVAVVIRHVNIVEESHSRGNCPAYGKKCQKCSRDNHFKSICRSGNDKHEHESSHSRPKKGHKEECFHEVNEEKNKTVDYLANQVQSLFYHNVHFNAINMRMYTKIECNTPAGEVSKTDIQS